uniref:Eukaryotic translation elongation factor 1 epsilon-1 n=1 Tax=Gallus gallus TaxID=9031 RepID=A0A8V0YIJ9_CHICK
SRCLGILKLTGKHNVLQIERQRKLEGKIVWGVGEGQVCGSLWRLLSEENTRKKPTVHFLSAFIPILQTNSGPGLTGLITIASHLVKQAKKEQLLGSSAEEKAVVHQWLEYRVTQVGRQSSREDTRTVLKDLNAHLEDKVYLAGNSFTLADILMYYGLHHVMVDLTVQEKEIYLNVSRWFNHIQHYPGVRQHLTNVIFIKNRLYTSAH